MMRHLSGENVRAYYDRNAAAEWERLERHRTEFAVTLRALRFREERQRGVAKSSMVR